MSESIFTRYRGFFFERTAATPWRSRMAKSVIYAGLCWLVMVIGILLLKYAFDLIEKSIVLLLCQSFILPLVLFAIFVYGYMRADSTKQLHDQKDQQDEKP